MLIKVIALAALAVAVAAAVVIFLMPGPTNPGAPNVRFTEFTPDRLDISVGEATRIVFNVQNLESRSITDARVITVIEPSVDRQILSIDRPTIELPDLQGRDARTGEIQVAVTAVSSPAIQATYKVKGVLVVEGEQSDVREFQLTIRQ